AHSQIRFHGRINHSPTSATASRYAAAPITWAAQPERLRCDAKAIHEIHATGISPWAVRGTSVWAVIVAPSLGLPGSYRSRRLGGVGCAPGSVVGTLPRGATTPPYTRDPSAGPPPPRRPPFRRSRSCCRRRARGAERGAGPRARARSSRDPCPAG